MVRYRASKAKRVLRALWDTPIVCCLHELLGRPLTYLGLPGPDLEDLREWKPWLGQCTAVEIEEKYDVPRAMAENRVRYGLNETGLQILRGDIDDVALTGHDLDGRGLALEKYDVVFPDYCGGWLYKDHVTGRSKRYSAFKALLERQRNGADKAPEDANTFLLLLGVNVRSDDEGEVQNYVKHSLPLSLSLKHADAIRRLSRKGNEHWFLKYYVANNIAQAASAVSFASYIYPPVYYRSSRQTAMMRFAAFLSLVPRSDAPQPQTQNVNRLPLAALVNNEVVQLAAPKPLTRFVDRLQPLPIYIKQAKSAATKLS